jgi:hypothetical protein
MLFRELVNLAILFFVLAPLIAILSVYSFKYYAALNKVSPKAVELFLDGLIFPMRWFYNWNKKGMYYERLSYTPERIASSLYTQRVMISVLPVLFIFASIGNIVRLFPTGDTLIFRYILVLIILPIFLALAWRFGRKLMQIEDDLKEHGFKTNI